MSEPKEILPKYKCICPKCKTNHQVRMRWIGGNIVPRIFCPDCKTSQTTKELNIEEHYAAPYKETA